MRRKIIKPVGILIIAVIIMLLLEVKVNASLQSRPGVTVLHTTANGFFELIRGMEASGGTLGMNASIDGTTFMDISEEKNGVDVHMAKNTEWGTVAMLAASAYGIAPSGQSNASTTGNETGVFQMADDKDEYVAGIYNISNSLNSKIFNADGRYKEVYTGAVSKPGDATTETANWKGASKSRFPESVVSVFIRDYGGLFGFGFYSNSSYAWSSRAALVLGTEL